MIEPRPLPNLAEPVDRDGREKKRVLDVKRERERGLREETINFPVRCLDFFAVCPTRSHELVVERLEEKIHTYK